MLIRHGLTPEALNQTQAQDWIRNADLGIEKTSDEIFAHLHLVGLSLGGTLCAHIVTRYP
ncbi:MAG: hypothetical protein R2877_01150 [Bdellovibrionota bacterium]